MKFRLLQGFQNLVGIVKFTPTRSKKDLARELVIRLCKVSGFVDGIVQSLTEYINRGNLLITRYRKQFKTATHDHEVANFAEQRITSSVRAEF